MATATILGSSSSLPIPRPTCDCAQCAEARADSRFRRTRSGLHIDTGSEFVLVDTGPDIAHQLDREGFTPKIDRVIMSHTHGDHCAGLNDLVRLRDEEVPLIVHAARWHQERLSVIFPNLLREPHPRIRFEAGEPALLRLVYDEISIEGFETGHHDDWPTTGVLLTFADPRRRVAYATDMGDMPTESRERLRGVDLLVADGTGLGGPVYGHPGTDALKEVAKACAVGGLLFTHVGHWQLSAEAAHEALGPNATLVQDGTPL
jgi:phosphoribosyl 1,2-cyclic phosphate phosphodiesterase